MSVADIFKKTYQQIAKDKCEAGGGKHVNLVVDPTIGYCLCPEGQAIIDSANPKCAPLDPKVPYNPFNSGFYRDGTQCKPEEGLVTQKHPFHQNFGEAACASPAPACAQGFEKQQLRYDGEILDYCVRKDGEGKFVSSYYPTTFLVRPQETTSPVKEPPKEEEKKQVPTWVWWVGGAVVAIIVVAVVGVFVMKLFNNNSSSTPEVNTPINTPMTPPPIVSPLADVPPAPTTKIAFTPPAPPMKGGKRKLTARPRK